jgi:2-polyprenyl-6-methoxyphenol hydroxylase-like FAD-dependent oxidoreductase
MLGRFTLHDNRTLFLFVFAANRSELPNTLTAQKALLRDLYGRGRWECEAILRELGYTDELYFDSVSQIRMQHWSRGRVALVGDAAYCVSLLAGQGSALAMIAAYVLAGELSASRGGYQQAFASYEARLRSYFEAKQRGAERFAQAFAPKTRAGLYFRNMIVHAFAIPGVARLAIGRDISDRIELPDYQWPMLARSAVGRHQACSRSDLNDAG